MLFVGNSMNNRYPEDLVRLADCDALEQIDLAVAYVSKMDSIFDLAKKRDVPLNLYTLADGDGFPALGVARRFIESKKTTWRLFLTRGFYHPKVVWFRGVGALVGSANLTDAAWYRNLECGIWLDQADLDRLSWGAELAEMLRVVHEHCREARAEDLIALEEVQKRRAALNEAERKLKADIDKLLGDLPGARSPADVTKSRERGGAARAAFLKEWDAGLTILRKIAALFADRRDDWPAWVDRNVPPSILQDQATEAYWATDFRRSGESGVAMMEAHERNKRDPDAAVRAILDAWLAKTTSGDEERWTRWVNENPKELHVLLAFDGLQALDEERLARIVVGCHAAREHGRQMRNVDLGLDENDKRGVEERAALYARFLMAQRSAKGKTVRDVLEFVLWGDKLQGRSAPPAPERIWLAAHDDTWKLPHLGPHILGELIGYARPDDYPPRNNRVSKTLYALGFDVSFQ